MRKRGVVILATVFALVLSFPFSNLQIVSGEEIPTRGDGIDEHSRWLQFRGNLNNTGYSSSSVPSTNDSFLEFQTLSQVRSSAVYANGIIYFGSQGRTIYAVEASLGTVIWSNETGSRIESTPLYQEGTLYVTSADSYLYAFNASTGDLLWRFKTDDEIISSPKYYDGIVYFGSLDWSFYAVNVSDQSHYWGAPFQTGGQIWGTPAIADERVFFGSNDGNFYSVWIENGTLDWNFTIASVFDGSVRYSSAAVYEGRVLVGSDDRNFYCLDEITGEKLWNITTESFIYSSPAVHNDTVFFTNEDYAYAILLDPNSNGLIEPSEVLWKVPVSNFEGGSSVAVAEGMVLVGTTDTDFGLICLNEEDGSPVWNFSIPGGTVSSPTVVDGKVFIGGWFGMYGLGSSGLPSLDVEIIPEFDRIKSNRVMSVTFLITHDQEPVEGAFGQIFVSLGELSQQQASTFPDGTNSVKYTAPTVQENTTVTITVIANKAGYDEGRNSHQIVVEPGTAYGDVGADSEFPWHKYVGYIGAVVALVVVNVALVVLLVKRRKTDDEEDIL